MPLGPYSAAAVILAAALAFLAAACSPQPSCDLAYERLSRCERMPLPRDTFVALCRNLKDQGELRAEVRCSTRKKCPAFRACVEQARKAETAERLRRDFARAGDKARSGDHAALLAFCRFQGELPADLAERCRGVPALATEALMTELRGRRDRGEVGLQHDRCDELRSLAARTDDHRRRAADLLCQEIEVARLHQATFSDLDKRLNSERPTWPRTCSAAQVRRVEQVSSPFGKALRERLVDACYRRLAPRLLTLALAQEAPACPAEDVVRAVKALKLTDPLLDPLMVRATERCARPAPASPAAPGPAAPRPAAEGARPAARPAAPTTAPRRP
jgi:hypothetical protein